ncbi:MAG: hypothetical protein ACOYXN_01805, partial [Acidobacteriota bacterium]
MRKQIPILLAALAFCLVLAGILSFAQAPPKPIFENVRVHASCEEDVQHGGYRYTYAVTNPAENTISLWDINLPLGVEVWEVAALFGPLHWSKDTWGREFSPNPEDGLLPPSVSWNASDDPFLLLPGGTVAPLGYSVPVPPTVREAWIYAWLEPWFIAYRQAAGEDYDDPAGLKREYIRKIPTLAPLPVPPGTFEHWDVFLSDVAKAGELGWVSDAGLLAGIREN